MEDSQCRKDLAAFAFRIGTEMGAMLKRAEAEREKRMALTTAVYDLIEAVEYLANLSQGGKDEIRVLPSLQSVREQLEQLDAIAIIGEGS